jgi:TolB-like protein/DNA-binding winged helix-turn-helix (wHTH) protein/Flp pilus assembly protein TadD
MNGKTSCVYAFGAFRIEVRERQLSRDGQPVPLPPKVFDVLLALVENSGHIVGKDELMKKVWGDTFVEEANLTVNISALRKVLHEDSHEPQFIETIPKRGYRFIAPVAELSDEIIDPVAKKHIQVEPNFPVAAERHETPRSRNVLSVAKWRREETEDMVAGDAEGEAEARRGDTATQHIEEREIAPHDLPNFLNPINRSKRLAFFVSASLAVVVIAGFAWSRWFNNQRQPTTAAVASPIDSIAVLPFENAARDANAEYLSDGITESVINRLSQLSNLKVMSRSSVFRYKGKEQDTNKVGNELNVRAVLTGSVKQIGDQIVITVRLDDAQNNQHIWGEQYVRRFADILNVQSEIAREVSTNLRVKLTGGDEQQIAKRYTENAEAYRFYLRGRYFWNKRTEDGIKKAIEEFQQAVDRDPNYALGYVGLADSYVFLHEFADAPASETLPKARAAADRAIQFDDSLAEAHASSALIHRHLWRWSEAEEEFKRAINLNPDYAPAHLWFSIYLRNKRRFDDALREMKQAQELDPLSPVIGASTAYVYVLKNDLDSAVEQCQRTLELDPNSPLTHELLGIAYLKQQRYEEATAEFQKAVELSGRANSRFLSSLGYCYAVTGRRAEALAVLKELEERYAKRGGKRQFLAGVCAGLGERDQAFAWLERDFEQRGVLLPEITWRFPGASE